MTHPEDDSMFKFPWTKRADRDREARIEAEEKLTLVESDWEDLVRPVVSKIRQEDSLNNWTENLKRIYIGSGG